MEVSVISCNRSAMRRSWQEKALRTCSHKHFSSWISIGQLSHKNSSRKFLSRCCLQIPYLLLIFPVPESPYKDHTESGHGSRQYQDPKNGMRGIARSWNERGFPGLIRRL